MSETLDLIVEQLRILNLESEGDKDPAICQEADAILLQKAEQNLPEFMFALAQALANVNNNAVVRQAAGLYLKNCLTSENEEEKAYKQQRWLGIDARIRKEIQTEVLDALSTDPNIPSQAAQCLASIACTEMPVKQGGSILESLTDNINEVEGCEEDELRERSLEALGYICEDLNSRYLKHHSEPIVTALCHAMRMEEMNWRIKLLATRVLSDCLTIAGFDDKPKRAEVMRVLCLAHIFPRGMGMGEAPNSRESHKIKVAVLQNLVKIARMYYKYLESHTVIVFPITNDAIKSEMDEQAIQGFEFWSAICEKEIELIAKAKEAGQKGRKRKVRISHFIDEMSPQILPVLCTALARHREDDLEKDDTVRKAAGKCLVLFTMCVGDDIIAGRTVPQFIRDNIGNADWRFREAAVYALGTIMKGPSIKRVAPVAMCHLGKLMQIVVQEDEVDQVRDTAAWSLGRICQILQDVVVTEVVLHPLLQVLVKGLGMEPRVASNMCWAICSLAEGAFKAVTKEGDDDPPTYALSGSFPLIVENLILAAERQGMRNTVYQTMNDLFQYCSKDCHETALKAATLLLQQLGRALQVEHQFPEEEREYLVIVTVQICSILKTLLKKLQTPDAVSLSDLVMQVVEMILKSSIGGIEEVQFHTMCTVDIVVTVTKLGFLKYLESFTPLLIGSLQAAASLEAYMTALVVVGDLAKVLKSHFSVLLNYVMPVLMQSLSDPNCHRTIKPNILSLVGDIALAVGSDFKPYLETSLEMLEQVTKMEVDKGDPELVGCLNILRVGCLEGYVGILRALKGVDVNMSGDVKLFEPAIPVIMKYIEGVALDDTRTAECVSACGETTAELCSVYSLEVMSGFAELRTILKMLEKGTVSSSVHSGLGSPQHQAKNGD